MPVKTIASAAAAIALLASLQAARADDGPAGVEMGEAVKIASTALAKGYGNMCDLDAMPAVAGKSSGYYRCVDIGPYRFVQEYSGAQYRMAGYVVAGGEPFRFLQATGMQVSLLYRGPWEKDLLPQAQKYWDDMTGATEERKRALEPDVKRTDAERRLQEFLGKGKAADPAAAPAAAEGTAK